MTLRSLPSLGSLVIQEDRESRGLAAGEAAKTAPTTADSACALLDPTQGVGGVSGEEGARESPLWAHARPPTINRAPEPPLGRQSSQT